MRLRLAALVLGCLCLSGGLVAAQEQYPNKLIKIIVPIDPGTGPDILARTIAQTLGEKWAVPVMVENRPGASTMIGSEFVAKAPADGYTTMVTANTFVLNQSLYKAPRYHPVNDFAPVIPLGVGRLALVTHPSLKATSVKEFLSLAKAEPGQINYGSPGNGTPHHLAMELFKQITGIEITHVPYRTTAGAMQDLLGGRTSVMFLPVHVILPQVEAGKLNMLAAGGSARAAATPQIPSLAEAAGAQNIDVDVWYAMYVPAGTPQSVIAKLNAETNAILKLPDVQTTLSRQGLTVTGGRPEDLGALTKADLERWANVVRAAKIEPN